MGKKEKVVDLKPKVDKISEDHLKELQSLVNKINLSQISIGKLEAKKHKFLHDLALFEDKVILFQDKLEKEYGTYDVNITDGKINWPKDEK
jgi:hypothetical protein